MRWNLHVIETEQEAIETAQQTAMDDSYATCRQSVTVVWLENGNSAVFIAANDGITRHDLIGHVDSQYINAIPFCSARVLQSYYDAEITKLMNKE